MPAIRVRVMSVMAIARAFHIGEYNTLAIIGQVGRQKGAPDRFFAAQIAHPVVGDVPWLARTAAEPLPYQAATADHAVGQDVAQLRVSQTDRTTRTDRRRASPQYRSIDRTCADRSHGGAW